MSFFSGFKWDSQKTNFRLCLITSLYLVFTLLPISSWADELNATGWNYYGQLGDGTGTSRSTPVQVAVNVSQVAAGWGHSLFVKTDGTLWAAGDNQWGQLGDGTTIGRFEPVQVATDVSQISAGEGHSLFVKTDGTLWAMGQNEYGQLGDGTQTDRFVPVKVATAVTKTAGGDRHSLFLAVSHNIKPMLWIPLLLLE